MSYLTTASAENALAESYTFKSRIRQAMTDIALDVSAEVTTTVNHVNRVQFARMVLLNDLPNVVAGFARAIPVDGLTGHDATDSALRSRIVQLWDAFSGVA